MPLVKVTGTNYVRDTSSMAITSVDKSEQNEYYSKLRMVKNQKEEINKLKSELDGIRSDVSDIKNLLQQLLGKGSNG